MANQITDGFEPGDDEKVISILDKWKGGPLSDNLFTKIASIIPQTSLITVVFRENAGKVETLLLKRPDTDPIWPNTLNLPGKMFRKSDFERKDNHPENGPIERIENSEIGTKFSKRPEFAGIAFQDTLRGPTIVLVYVVAEDILLPEDGEWCGVDKVNSLSNMIETELVAIDVALRSYSAGVNHLPSLNPVEFQKKSA
jgi:hypothetical protein